MSRAGTGIIDFGYTENTLLSREHLEESISNFLSPGLLMRHPASGQLAFLGVFSKPAPPSLECLGVLAEHPTTSVGLSLCHTCTLHH